MPETACSRERTCVVLEAENSLDWAAITIRPSAFPPSPMPPWQKTVIPAVVVVENVRHPVLVPAAIKTKTTF